MRVARTEYNISWQIAILPFFIARAWSYIICTKILRKVQRTAYKMVIAMNIQYNYTKEIRRLLLHFSIPGKTEILLF